MSIKIWYFIWTQADRFRGVGPLWRNYCRASHIFFTKTINIFEFVERIHIFNILKTHPRFLADADGIVSWSKLNMGNYVRIFLLVQRWTLVPLRRDSVQSGLGINMDPASGISWI